MVESYLSALRLSKLQSVAYAIDPRLGGIGKLLRSANLLAQYTSAAHEQRQLKTPKTVAKRAAGEMPEAWCVWPLRIT